MMNPEFDLTDVPLDEHPGAISAALDALDADLEGVRVNPTAGD